MSDLNARRHPALVGLFEEFRALLAPTTVEGVPDYTPAAMARKCAELQCLRDELAAYDVADWDVAEQIDYEVVRAEMAGVAFDHEVLRPWARDPGFYNITDGVYPRLLVHYSRMDDDWSPRLPCLPLAHDELDAFGNKLRCVPKILEQARGNLTEVAGDLATAAIRVQEGELIRMREFVDALATTHPELSADAEQALAAMRSFREWIIDNMSRMTAAAGIGKDNYNRWLNDVLLVPHSWDDLLTIIRNDYHRAIAFLKLEEHKNRDLPPFELTASEAENLERQGTAAQELLVFLRDREIISIPDDLEPLPRHLYPRTWGKSAYLRPDYRGFFEQCCDREPITQITHTFFGHYYVHDRTIWYQDGDSRPIRGTIRLFDMHESRSEALSFGIEEMMLQLGAFDHRPRAKEITYIWMAFRAARAISDLKMHANEYTMQEGIEAFVEMLPYPWADTGSDAVWWDIEEALRAPAHSVSYVGGKNMILQLLTECAQRQGSEFELRRFMDDFMGGGIIPISLTHWEMTGHKPH
jgi:hypothetical protein